MAIFDNENERLHALSVVLAVPALTFIFLISSVDIVTTIVIIKLRELAEMV
jgi:hypothetical protein